MCSDTCYNSVSGRLTVARLHGHLDRSLLLLVAVDRIAPTCDAYQVA